MGERGMSDTIMATIRGSNLVVYVGEGEEMRCLIVDLSKPREASLLIQIIEIIILGEMRGKQ